MAWCAIWPARPTRRSSRTPPRTAPAWLLSIASTAVDAGDAWADLDWAEAAKSNAEQHNTMVTSFVCNPATALAVSTIKETTTSARTLLGADPTAPASRTVAGVPLLTSSTIADGILWGIPKSRVVVALRSGTEVTTDTSAFFTSHRVAVSRRVEGRLGVHRPGSGQQDRHHAVMSSASRCPSLAPGHREAHHRGTNHRGTMSRCEGASPTLDELRVAFTELLDRAVAHGEATPTETWLDNRVLDAIDDVARAWPQVPDELIAKARNRFARYERRRARIQDRTAAANANRRRS